MSISTDVIPVVICVVTTGNARDLVEDIDGSELVRLYHALCCLVGDEVHDEFPSETEGLVGISVG